jgi:hypothetical protein
MAHGSNMGRQSKAEKAGRFTSQKRKVRRKKDQKGNKKKKS